MVGEKISITSRKPQTTRNRLLGIQTEGDTQIIYVDTPGLHSGGKRVMNRMMNRKVFDAIADVDLVVFLIEAMQWKAEDDLVIEHLKECPYPIFLAVNKVDKVKNKEDLLPFIETIKAKLNYKELFLISAKNGRNVEKLVSQIRRLLPEGPHFFPATETTDQKQNFLFAELVREKLIRVTGQEIPYATAVVIEQSKLVDKIQHISALILVEREGQKKIVIGKKGEKLKEVGRLARLDMERKLGHKVFLQLWVKVKTGWSDNQTLLKNLGYSD